MRWNIKRKNSSKKKKEYIDKISGIVKKKKKFKINLWFWLDWVDWLYLYILILCPYDAQLN